MPGFWERIIASRVLNEATGVLETAESLRSTFTILPVASQIDLFSENHSAGVTGPATWTVEGSGRFQTFDTSGFGVLPANIKAVVMICQAAIDYLTTQAADTQNLLFLGVANNDATYFSGPTGGMQLIHARDVRLASAPTSGDQSDIMTIVPCLPGKRVLRFRCVWPNLANPLANCFIFARIIGYIA